MLGLLAARLDLLSFDPAAHYHHMASDQHHLLALCSPDEVGTTSITISCSGVEEPSLWTVSHSSQRYKGCSSPPISLCSASFVSTILGCPRPPVQSQ